MATHSDLLRNMPLVRAALVRRFKWFIHTTPEVNIGSILSHGLLANKDAPAPCEVKKKFEADHVPILCLHPLGAKLCPRGAFNSLVLSLGADDPKFVSFAVAAADLPDQLDLDWSYEWHQVQNEILFDAKMTVEDLVIRIADKFGSIASYDKIEPGKLRVYCQGNAPANPLSWSQVVSVSSSDIVRHL